MNDQILIMDKLRKKPRPLDIVFRHLDHPENKMTPKEPSPMEIAACIIIQKYSNSLNKPIENLEIFLKLNDQDDVKSVDIDDNKMYIHIYEKSSGKAKIVIYDVKNGKKLGNIFLDKP